jgi:3-phenylpropionate/trans-cinnamate dioxygenase ferredoxin subunit
VSRIDLCSLEDLPEGVVRAFELDELDVVVSRSGMNVFAVENRCSHDDGGLADGRLLSAGDTPEIECTRHGARFNMSSGAATRMPAVAPIEAISGEIADGRIWLDLPDD